MELCSRRPAWAVRGRRQAGSRPYEHADQPAQGEDCHSLRIRRNVIVRPLASPPQPSRTIRWPLLGLASLLAGCGGCGPALQAHPSRATPLVSIFEAPLSCRTLPGRRSISCAGSGWTTCAWSCAGQPSPPARRPGSDPAGFAGASPARLSGCRTGPRTTRSSGPRPRARWACCSMSRARLRSGRAAAAAPRGGAPGVWRPSAAAVRALRPRRRSRATAAATRLPPAAGPLPRVSFWSVWNEPNLGQANLAPQAIDNSTVETSPAMYRALWTRGWASLQATGHGRDTILIGELAPYGGRHRPPDVPGELRLHGAAALRSGALLRRFLAAPARGTAAAQRGCPTTAAASRSFARENPALFQASGFAMHPYANAGVRPQPRASGRT